MDMPHDLITNVNKYIEDYEERKKEVPEKVFVGDEVFLRLDESIDSMLMPDSKKTANNSYTGYLLNNNKGYRIEVHNLHKLPQETKSKLEEMTDGKKMNYPIIFCCSGTVKKIKKPLTYDLSLSAEELDKKLEETEKEEKKQEKKILQNNNF